MPSRELVVAGGAQEPTPQHCGWKSVEVLDESKIFMATWEIADAVDLVEPDAKRAPEAVSSGEPAKAA